MGYLKCKEIEERFLRVSVSSSEDSVLSVSVRCALVKMTPLGSDPVSRDSSDLQDRKQGEQRSKLGDV